MNKLLALTWLFFLPVCLFGQIWIRLYPVATERDTIRFSVVETNGKLGIQPDKLQERRAFPAISSIYLTGTDLVMEYEYDGKNSRFSPQAIQIIGIQPTDSVATALLSGNIVKTDSPVSQKKGTHGQRIWLDVAENTLTYGETYHLIVERSIMDVVDCRADKRPEFKSKQYFPHIAGGILAAGSVGLAHIYKRQKNDAYENYLNAWRNGETENQAEAYFNEAQDKDKIARNLNRYGWLAMGFNAGLAIYRWSVIRKKQEVYDTWCGKPTDLSFSTYPVIQAGASAKGVATFYPGLKVECRF